VQQVEMLCELRKAEKFYPRARLLPIPFLYLLLVTLALVAHAPVARAQSSEFSETGGEISGIVVSQDDRILSQVVVGLKSHPLGVFRSVLTDFGGQFDVRGLPAGTYEVVVEESGYESVRTKAQLEGSFLKLVLRLTPVKWARAHRDKYTVSVRDLRISGKARDDYQKGLECVAKNDFPGSAIQFKKAVKAFPEYYEALSQLGMADVHLGKLEEARKAFQSAIDISKGRYATAQFGFGYLLYLEGQADEAELILRRGLEVDGDAPDGHAILAMVLLTLNRLDEAEKSAGEALLRRPGFAEAYLVLADVYARRHNYRQQLQDLEMYLRLEPRGPGSARAHQAREVALKMLGERSPQN
jgi:tetratricopeptide (TPR) repeat protein